MKKAAEAANVKIILDVNVIQDIFRRFNENSSRDKIRAVREKGLN